MLLTMTRNEVAAVLKVHPNSAFARCRKMGCPVIDLGHRTKRVRPEDLADALERLSRGAGPAVIIRVNPLAGKTKRAGISTGPRRVHGRTTVGPSGSNPRRTAGQ
jgi:hypothetical protein